MFSFALINDVKLVDCWYVCLVVLLSWVLGLVGNGFE